MLADLHGAGITSAIGLGVFIRVTAHKSIECEGVDGMTALATKKLKDKVIAFGCKPVPCLHEHVSVEVEYATLGLEEKSDGPMFELIRKNSSADPADYGYTDV